jgi:hypothetical protein
VPFVPGLGTLLWEDSHEAIGRSSMETALTSILSSETGSYVALRRASLRDGAGRGLLMPVCFPM